MKIAFNPSNSSKNILDLIKNNKDIIFDLKGHSIYARGVEFKGTDTNTWRPVVDNLTSNSATSSLSANQGRVLAGLINGKSDSDHNHDGRYVKKSGDTMFGVLTIDTTNFGALIIKGNDDANGAFIQFRGKSNIYGYIGLNNSTKDKQFLRWNSDTSRIYTILDTSSTYTANGKGVINGTTITQVDNATNSTNSTNARKLVNWYSARPTSLNAQFGDGSLRIFYATSSTTVGKCPDDATVLHLAWENNEGWDIQLALAPEKNKMYFRGQNKSTWQSWKTLAFTTDIPSSLKNPYSFNVFGVIYDGSAAKVVGPSNFISQVTEGTSTITDGTMLITSYASNSGFADTNAVNVPYKRKAIHLWEYIKAKTDSLYATKSHNHDGRYVYNYGGTAANGQTLNQNALFMSTTSGISGDWWHILQAAWSGECRWNSQIAFPTQNRNGMYYRSGLDDNSKWGSWVKLLDANNYSSTLDSRYYTETEVNTLLDAKLNRQNLSYGTWNPRGYHLAADYNYNGGDLSISESGGQIHVSVDGYFWQNEGQYRVLDTSDVAGLKGNLTVYQHLSNTDTTWWPLIWGGSSHNNTSNSTGAVYKSHDVLSWQTSSQTLYATNIQTENIKHLSIGGGIYWNPNVESASDGSDAASITLVKAGVAGGTTLVLSQMNDAGDTIQFKTNTAARLYHNSYPILTTQNTYVSNNKGYINGTEITQVNNADKVDNRHAISTIPNTGIIYKAAIYTSSLLTSYWVRLASIPSMHQNSEFVATIHVQSGHSNPGRSAILLVYLRGEASSLSKSFKICCNSNYDPNRFRLYYKDSDKTSEIWYQTTGWWDGIITTVISQSSEGSLYEGLTLYSGSITAVQTPSMSTYLSAQVSTITDNISGNASTATKLATPRKIWGQSFDGTADVDNTLRIRHTTGNYCEGIRIQTGDGAWSTIILGATADSGTNANAWSIHRKSDNNFAISRNSPDGANGLVMTPTGMGLGTTSPTQRLDVAGNIRTTGNLYISHATNNNMNHDTSNPRIVFSESGHQAVGLVYTNYDSYRLSKGLKVMDTDNNDTSNVWFEVQGYNYSSGYVKNGSNDNYVLLGGGGHKTLSDFASSSHSHNYAANENYGGFTKSGRLPISGFYQSYASESGGNAPWSSWMHLINCQHSNTNNNYALQIAASFYDNNTFKIRVTNNSVNNAWRDIIHSGNIGSQTVANAYHLRINSANTWSTWYWAGQSGQPSWLWGSNDGTNMYVWNPNNFNVNTAQYLRSLGNQNCQTGRTQNYGDVYSYNTYSNNTGSPTSYTSVIGFGRGIGGTVEIAGGWRNTHLYWRSLGDCCEDWYSWRIVLDSSNYSEFIGNYYWANVKISASSSTTTSPTVHTLTATRVCAGYDPGMDNSISCSNWFRSSGNTGWYNTTYRGGWYMSDTSWIRAHNGVGIYTSGQIYSSNSIRMGSILLERTNEINSSDNLFINYRSSTNVSLCLGGGNVGIGILTPTQKLDVRGNIITKGFGIQPYYLSKSILLPIIRPGDGYTYKCLEIDGTTEISCIIADRAGLMDERGILIKFNKGYDGQIILLKDLQNYGGGNGFFWVMPSGCKIIRADGSGILIDQNQISNTYDDGHSRFLVYSSVYSVWIEFLCG